jgi:hypothetical protein
MMLPSSRPNHIEECKPKSYKALLVKTFAIWIFSLVASIAIGGIIGAWFWLSDSSFAVIFDGMIVGGFIFTCLSIWRNW